MNRESAWSRWLAAIGAEQRCGDLVAPCPLADRPGSAHRSGGDPYKVVISPGRERPVVLYCRCCGAGALYDILSEWGVGNGEIQRWAREAGWEGAAAEPPPQYDFDLLHRAYTELLRLCPLTDADRQWLRKRGASDQLADYCVYGSIPSERQQREAAWLAVTQQIGLDYEAVPGLCHRDDLRGPGVAIPCRGPDGRIRAIKVRLTSGGRVRMRLLSSRASGGLPAVNDLHFPLGNRNTKQPLWITEGERKSDVVASTGVQVVAVPGVGCVERAIRHVESLSPVAVHLAFDADAAGRKATETAVESLRRSSWRGRLGRVVWGEGLKGIDDAIAAGESLRFEPIELGEPLQAVPSPTPTRPRSLSDALGSRPWRESEFRDRYPQFNRDLSGAIRSGAVRLVRVATVGGCVATASLTEQEWREWIAKGCR